MAIVTYLDANCLIAYVDTEEPRRSKVIALFSQKERAFMSSPFLSLETLPLALHYRKPKRAQFFNRYFRVCRYFSDDLPEIMRMAHQQAEKYGIVGLDACHIAAAIVGRADEFYTFEKPTKPMFRTKEIKVISLL